VIGANLPDVDAISHLDGPLGDLAFRRGWTHGILTLALWPFVLTAAVLLLDRLWRRPSAFAPRLVPREVLRLAALAIVSHPILDTLNTYGVRWLMPFDGRWFYGDTLFIVDPWMWLALGTGVLLSRRRPGVARAGLAVATIYVVLMAAAGVAARRVAAAELRTMGGEPDRLMVSPVPLDPFSRRVVARQREVYRTASFHWLRRPHLDPATVRTWAAPDPDDPALRAASATMVGRRFLGWARFPRVELTRGAGGELVNLIDLRYREQPGSGFAAVAIPLAATPR
jgi:inner membrane protein